MYKKHTIRYLTIVNRHPAYIFVLLIIKSQFERIAPLSRPSSQHTQHYNFSKHLVLVNISLVNLQTCFAAFSSALGDFPLKRSKFGKK